jgi:hypothetical protein
VNIGFDEFAGCVPTVEFEYPEDGNQQAQVVRDQWREAPLMTKCQQRFAVVPSGDVMTMPLLDKRMEVLRYALLEAVERMDVAVIHRLAQKAIGTADRIKREQLAAATPGLRELHEDIVIHDDAEQGKVVVQFPERVDERTRRVLKIYGFCGSGHGAT